MWTRSFAGGATHVMLDTGGGAQTACAPEKQGAWSIAGTAQYFALASENATHRLYNLSCTSACSTSWHTASAVSVAPFTGLHIVFNMQPGFKPVQDSGAFDETCTVIEWKGGGNWCAAAENPQCKPVLSKKSCITWASGRTTGNAC